MTEQQVQEQIARILQKMSTLPREQQEEIENMIDDMLQEGEGKHAKE